MQIEDVPQDPGMINDHRKEVCYAVDEKGTYVLTGSAGWEPKNIANGQAWDEIHQAVVKTIEKIRAGKASALAYHMAKHQMNLGLLSQYVGFSRFKVWLHLKPGTFGRLAPDVLQQYADVFDISVQELKAIPDDNLSV